MKLNYDYIRQILLYVEEKSSYDSVTRKPNSIPFYQVLEENKFSSLDKDELQYALELLIEDGFFKCKKEPKWYNGELLEANILCLSSMGNDFLNAVRNDTVWNEVTSRAKNLSCCTLKGLAQAAISIAPQLLSDSNSVNNLMENVKKVVETVF